MRKFFDSRRELVSSGPGSGGGGGSSSGSSHAGANFVGRGFTVGRHQVTVEEIIAEGEEALQRPDDAICLFPHVSTRAVVALLHMSCTLKHRARKYVLIKTRLSFYLMQTAASLLSPPFTLKVKW